MAKQFDEVMAVKGLSFFDWDGLDTNEYNKLSSIINTSNKSPAVELLFEDENTENTIDTEVNENGVGAEEEIVEVSNDEVTEEVDVPEGESDDSLEGAEDATTEEPEDQTPEVAEVAKEAQVEENGVAEEQEDPETAQVEEDEAPQPEAKEQEEKGNVVDIENSVLQPSAPVFQPSIPPPSMLPFTIALPHWAQHHHMDPNMPHPAHHQHHPHHHQPQTAGPYSYAVPGGYVFHPHDPNLSHHHPHGEPTTLPHFVTLSNGHATHQSPYALPGHHLHQQHHHHPHQPQHHHISAHYPYHQSNTLAAASGLPSPLSHAVATHHHQPHHPHHNPHHHNNHHHQQHHNNHHIPSPGDVLHHHHHQQHHPMSNNSVIPTTLSHHHQHQQMGFSPLMTTAAVGQHHQQPLPAHIIPPRTHHQPNNMPHHPHQQHHHNLNRQQQQQQQQQSTQPRYAPQEKQQQQQEATPSVPSPSPPAPSPPAVVNVSPVAAGSGDNDTANVCANNSNNVDTRVVDTVPELPQSEKEESKPPKPQNSDNSNDSGAIPEKVKESPSKFTLSEIEFGGPVVFDTKPQPVAANSTSKPLEKTPTKSPATKSKTKKSPLPSSQQTTKSTLPKKDKSSSTPPKHKPKPCPVVDSSNVSESHQRTETDSVHIKKKDESSLKQTNHSNVKSAKTESSPVNKETAIPDNASSSLITSSSSKPIPSSTKPSVNKKNASATNVNSLPPSVNSSETKGELNLPESTKASNKEAESQSSSSDNNKLPQPTPAPVAAAPIPSAPKSWSSLFGKRTASVPSSQALPSNAVPESHPVAKNESRESSNAAAPTPSVTSVRHWQEQERHKGKDRSDLLSPLDNVKTVDVRLDPLAPKLMAKLSNFPISYIPIIVQPRGLTNGRNICFMNATLQVLMGCPPFIHLFRAFRNLPARSGGNSSTPVFDSLVQFVNNFEHCQRTKQEGPVKKGSGYVINVGAPFIPESLLGVAQHILKLNIGVQHDAEEFLSQILSICNEEVERIIKMNNMDTLNNNSASTIGKNVMRNGNHSQPLHQNGYLNNHDEGNEDDGDGSWVQVGPKNYCVETNVNNCGQTPLSAIFAGLSRSTLVRDSGKTSDTVDSFFTLKLDIQTDNVHSVRDALVRLNATEDVHDVDGTKVKGHRRMFFDELPPVLIMHLKLFRYSNGIGQKIQKNISFDVHLQIPKEMMSRFGKSKYHSLKSRSYKLFGVVNHHGTKMDDGHYTSDVFLPIVNGWVHFDDTKVSSNDEATVLKHVDKCMPYLLFYRRVDA